MTGETDRHILCQVVGMLPTFVCIPMERTNLSSHFRGFFEIKSTLHRIRCFIRQPNHAHAPRHTLIEAFTLKAATKRLKAAVAAVAAVGVTA